MGAPVKKDQIDNDDVVCRGILRRFAYLHACLGDLALSVIELLALYL